MGLITRCPACGTMFKVVSDQLKVSDGWVRCGQCAEIFDAQLYWQSNTDFLLQQVPQAVLTNGLPLTDQVVNYQNTHLADQDPVIGSKVDEVATVQFESISPATLAASPPLKTDAEEQLVANAGDPNLYVPTGEVTESVFEDVSFVRNARRQAFWRSPLLRGVLALFAFILAGLFAAQLAVHQHSVLLAFAPGLKPWLQQICRPFACEIGLPKRIDAIVIDSSSFNKASEAGEFRLGFILKNASNIEVAMPSLEISLTDIQEQVIVRRVLSPSQFGASNGLIAANLDFSNTVTLQIQPDALLQRIAGYRLLAFYP